MKIKEWLKRLAVRIIWLCPLFKVFFIFSKKSAYVCGPLTELLPDQLEKNKKFYERIADTCEKATGARAFVPHEHYDPVKNANYTPSDVDAAERYQVSVLTNLLIVATPAPSWGGGIEVEMAYRSSVPIILLCEGEIFNDRKISRLLRGNPAVVKIIYYNHETEALKELAHWILKKR